MLKLAMLLRRPKVLVVDDDAVFLERILSILELLVCDVWVAHDEEDAHELIPQLKTIDIELALLDGNLAEESSDGRDGQRVAAHIREVLPNVYIVCCSSFQYDWGDEWLDKKTMTSDKLSELIERIQFT